MTASTRPPRRRLTRRARRLLAVIRDLGGEWTTGRAAAHLGCNPHGARRALRELADHGHVRRRGPRNRRAFHLNHQRKDHT